MFLQNKYTRIYFNIIDCAKLRTLPLEVYVEKHHIIPKSIGGSNSKENLVALTAREHFICHLLLTKMTVGMYKQKMTFAAWSLTMKKDILNKKISNRTYQRLKEERAALLKGKKMPEEQRLNLIKVNTGKVCSEEKRAKIRAARKLQITTEAKKMSDAHKRRAPMTQATKDKIGSKTKGHKKSPAAIQKIKAARSQQVITTIEVTCPHCGKVGGNRIMPRYHFDNCKSLKEAFNGQV